jgi:peptide-methionine (S)-S-oxide reductase
VSGAASVVQIVFDPGAVAYDALLRVFWESHDPIQGMRQGNDVGTQYRSGIYCYGAAQREQAEVSRRRYGEGLAAVGFGGITTEIVEAPEFYYAEDYHQQYLAKNPGGYGTTSLRRSTGRKPIPTRGAIRAPTSATGRCGRRCR